MHCARAADAARNQQRVDARSFGLEQWYRVSVPGDGLYAITCADLAGAGATAVELATVRILAVASTAPRFRCSSPTTTTASSATRTM